MNYSEYDTYEEDIEKYNHYDYTHEDYYKDTPKDTLEYDPLLIEAIEDYLPVYPGDRFSFNQGYLKDIAEVLDDWQYGFLKGIATYDEVLSVKQAEKLDETLEEAVWKMREANKQKLGK